MKKTNSKDMESSFSFFMEITQIIKDKQLETFRLANKSLVELYWLIGQKVVEKQQKFNWGHSVIHNLAKHLEQEFPFKRGFSVRNIQQMRNFYLTYQHENNIRALLYDIGWSHHIVIMKQANTILEKEYYIRATRKYGWTVNVLKYKMESSDFERFAIEKDDNFKDTLPGYISQQAKLAVKNHFIFDFLEMEPLHSEKEIEDALIKHLHLFITELGIGEFAFLGQQFKIKVGTECYFIDLLFFHRSLKCLIAFDLKIGKFKPEFAGKMNFYLTALDRQIRKDHENPSLGIILCKEKDKTVVEYALADQNKPIGAVTYTLRRKLPSVYRGLLPSPQMLKEQILQWDLCFSQKITEEKAIKENSNLNARQIKFLRDVTKNTKLTSSEYAQKMNVSASTALRDLKKLEKLCYVKKNGAKKNCYFIIL